MKYRTSLAIQLFRLCGPNAGSTGSVPGWGAKLAARSGMLPGVATHTHMHTHKHTNRHNQKQTNKKTNFFRSTNYHEQVDN